jgi:transmembrane 9 superfamily protein 2/4
MIIRPNLPTISLSLALLLPSLASAFYLPGASPIDYLPGDPVPLLVNSLTPQIAAGGTQLKSLIS